MAGDDHSLSHTVKFYQQLQKALGHFPINISGGLISQNNIR